eukprot:12307851-Ditylum_brightwellii.AAC.1
MIKTLKGKTIPKRKPFVHRRNHQQGKHVNHVQEEDDFEEDIAEEDNEEDVEDSDKEEVYASVLKIEEAFGKGVDIQTETNDEQVCLLASN